MNEYIETNRRNWDDRVPVHLASQFYDVASFKAGRSSLLSLEREEVGDVRGKTLLHLQCHFGLDTLSWAREGAIVTGVDFSSAAIEAARALAAELKIDARFVETDVYKLREVLAGSFDIVYASYGVICWLPDFDEWARIAASYLKPGGFLWLADGHPISNALADDATAESLRIEFPYVSRQAFKFEVDGSYADTGARLEHRQTVQFFHGLGGIVRGLVGAGLRVDFLREWPFCASQRLPSMTKGADGFWRLPGDTFGIPFMFSVRATKPG